MNITQKSVNVIKQTWTPYQFIRQIEVTCGWIEPLFLKQELCPLQHKLHMKKKNHPNTQNLKAQDDIKSLATTYDVDEEWSVKSLIHA